MFGEFDEAAYLRANPDVKGMIDRGIIRSGFEHWHAVGANEHALGDRVSGFYEHDLMYDEAAYLRQNPDVADAVRTRAVRNGYQHWIRFGRQEVTRGIRWGPFAAGKSLLRPFVVAAGDGVFLLVARAPDDYESADSVHIRAGTVAPVALGTDAVSCSEPVRIVDVCGAVTTVRLLVCAPPAELDLGHVVGRVTLSLGRAGSGQHAFVFRDRGIQAFFFETADEANEFLRIARERLGRGIENGFETSVEFALLHLLESPRSKGYEKPILVRVEEIQAVSDRGIRLSGWVALPRAKLEGCRVWCPEAREFSDLTRTWSRVPRADIMERFPEELAGAGDDLFGFAGVAEFREAVLAGGRRRVLFGVKEVARPERWLELEVSGR